LITSAPIAARQRALVEARDRRPVVVYNRRAPGFGSVVTDSDDGARQIAEHLAALGHRTVMYLSEPADAWIDGERWRALAARGAEVGLDVRRSGHFAPTLEHGSAAADVGLAAGASALVAFNDLLAIGTLRRLEHLGVDVPGEVSVVGFDDIFGADLCRPALTTVTSPAEQAGRMLVDLLLEGPAPGEEPGSVVLPMRLLVRDSAGPAHRPVR
jgi:DNA-binding LacI/PurR family transcriptional regulator